MAFCGGGKESVATMKTGGSKQGRAVRLDDGGASAWLPLGKEMDLAWGVTHGSRVPCETFLVTMALACSIT